MMSVEAAFHHFDTDNSGALSVDELREVLKRPGGGAPLSDEEIQQIIDEFDASESCSSRAWPAVAPPRPSTPKIRT